MHPTPFARPLRPAVPAFLALLAALLSPADGAGQLGRQAVLSGTVTSVEGGPVPGARVSAVPQRAGVATVASATTDEEGRYELEVRKGLPGRFLLRVEAEGFELLEEPIDLERGWDGTIDAELLPSSQVARQRAVTAYNAGVQALERGDLEAADPRFREAAEADPELAEARRGLAEIPLRKAEEVYNRGVEAFRAEDLDESLARFREALDLDPDLTVATVAIAKIHYTEGRYEEAARVAAGLLERRPDHVEGRRLRFLALEAADSPEAEAALAAYAEADPDAAVELLAEWAKDDFEADRRESAGRHLLRLLAIRPDHPEALYRLGLIYAGGGRPEEAKEHLRRFLELAPGHPDAEAARRLLDEL